MKNNQTLNRSLKNRHIQMIALGGCIGTGLFYGTAESIPLAGPGLILGYLLGGFVIYMIIRMLGEMATEEPVSGAFSYFANKYCGEYAGFLAGWNYWLLYVLVSMAELSAIGVYVAKWYPHFPIWATVLSTIIIVTAINLASVKFFGETEFWLALIKVLAVVGMIVFGIYLIGKGLFVDASTVKVSNLWDHGAGGLSNIFPNGVWGIWVSLVIVMFSFGGTELIGITAAEADNPEKTIPKAIKQVMWRILIFYIGSIIIMMILMPWTDIKSGISPFVMVFEQLDLPKFEFLENLFQKWDINPPSIADTLNFIILTAAISVYNSGIYSNGRMLFGLAEQGSAPKIFLKLNRKKIPYIAILFSSACTLAAVVINLLVPNGAFMIVMSVAIAAAVITWALIIIMHLRFRKAHEGQTLKFKTPFFPYVNYFCLVFLLVVIGAMTQLGSFKPAVIVLPCWIIITYVGFCIKKKMDKVSH